MSDALGGENAWFFARGSIRPLRDHGTGEDYDYVVFSNCRRGDARECGVCRDCKFSYVADWKSLPAYCRDENAGKTFCIAWGGGVLGELVEPDGFCFKWRHRLSGI